MTIVIIERQRCRLSQPDTQLSMRARDQRHDSSLVAFAVADDQHPGPLRDPEIGDLQRGDLTDAQTWCAARPP